MNTKHLSIMVSAVQGFITGAFITTATGGNYLVGSVGLVGLGTAGLFAFIPLVLMSIFDFEKEEK